ncbi:hypothetical protein [Nocardia sp. NPDC006630]|uniref:WXG100-like domain-containing protein n=1 Tax=Nocardia sp. NPDC006630 TaxID=3157181 RepID=UPI0033B5D1FF
MAIEIPHDVAMFLNFVGVPYPDINEDHVRELARHVRSFASNVQGTHASATGAINDMNSVYSGYSYEQLVAAWSRMSAGHLTDLDEACKVVAAALDIAAQVITGVKVAVLTELALMAASYATAMAATVVTSGMSAVVAQTIAAAARKIVQAMEQMVISYILSEVIMKAIEPLEHVVERMVSGALHSAAAYVMGVTPSSSSVMPLHIEPDEVLRYAGMLDKYADDMVDHATVFADNVANLSFLTSDGGTPAEVIDPAQPGITPDPTRPETLPGSTQPAISHGPVTPNDSGSGGPAALQARPSVMPLVSSGANPSWIQNSLSSGSAVAQHDSPRSGNAGEPSKAIAPAVGANTKAGTPAAVSHPDTAVARPVSVTPPPHAAHAAGVGAGGGVGSTTGTGVGARVDAGTEPGASGPHSPAHVASSAASVPESPASQPDHAVQSGSHTAAPAGESAAKAADIGSGARPDLTGSASGPDPDGPIAGADSVPSSGSPQSNSASSALPTSAQPPAAKSAARGRTPIGAATPWKKRSRPSARPSVAPAAGDGGERRQTPSPWSAPGDRPAPPTVFAPKTEPPVPESAPPDSRAHRVDGEDAR